ncbi:helix-turn-helix domain-containing protein [Cellulomonas pakistanensis]|uniref:Helix-turn-helix domain-containing protein n=1 Tax=Cellulomonas pakistanensis TaxID=992287 RepID=A0A919U8H3_9CELL|nr:helix-turn-helix domain-containing protein [Cellulomonas pakistanensis]GIG37932.1 hypothetical protein Cpa01nite_33130 [Cellulomonas pakistanensis]
MSARSPVGREAWLAAWHVAPHGHQTPAEQASIIALALYADPATGQWIWPSQATIAAQTGLSVSTVGRAIRQAVRDGWFIEVLSGRGRCSTSHYRLASPSASLADVQDSVRSAAAEASAVQLMPDNFQDRTRSIV